MRGLENKMILKDYIKVGLAVAILAVSVYLMPPLTLPFSSVPFTLQTLIIVLIAYLFKPTQAFVAITLYLFLGGIGLPIFSGGQGGFDKLIGPTGGFLVLFPFIAYFIAFFKSKDNHFINLLIGLLFSIGILYLLASLWLSYSINISYITAITMMLPFIPFDIIKVFLAYSIYRRLPEDLIYPLKETIHN